MQLKEIFLKALYPEHVVCCACSREARLNRHDLCERCRKSLPVANSAGISISGVAGVAGALAYGGAAADMVQRFKYGGAQWLAEPLAGFVRLPDDWKIDAIAPVPLHPAREKWRGYNQSELLSRHIGARYGLTVKSGMLSRVRDTESQTTMGARERKENVRDAFRAKACHGKTVLVVDDVITTGSTIEECARALFAGGAARVYAAAVCLAHGDG